MKLILYHFDSCPYCVNVRNAINDLKITDVEYRNTQVEPKYRDELRKLTGGTQVPCILIDGKPMLESEDIIHFLKKAFRPAVSNKNK